MGKDLRGPVESQGFGQEHRHLPSCQWGVGAEVLRAASGGDVRRLERFDPLEEGVIRRNVCEARARRRRADLTLPEYGDPAEGEPALTGLSHIDPEPVGDAFQVAVAVDVRNVAKCVRRSGAHILIALCDIEFERTKHRHDSGRDERTDRQLDGLQVHGHFPDGSGVVVVDADGLDLRSGGQLQRRDEDADETLIRVTQITIREPIDLIPGAVVEMLERRCSDDDCPDTGAERLGDSGKRRARTLRLPHGHGGRPESGHQQATHFLDRRHRRPPCSKSAVGRRKTTRCLRADFQYGQWRPSALARNTAICRRVRFASGQ